LSVLATSVVVTVNVELVARPASEYVGVVVATKMMAVIRHVTSEVSSPPARDTWNCNATVPAAMVSPSSGVGKLGVSAHP
jgi:hypothetical protein